MGIEFVRRGDGTTTLRCTRADGSVTWQTQRAPSHATFFALHDLTHYAVETTLGFRAGFYGLVADGWEITDFATPWPRGPIPEEAREVELLVGCFDEERRNITRWSAAEFNAHAAMFV